MPQPRGTAATVSTADARDAPASTPATPPPATPAAPAVDPWEAAGAALTLEQRAQVVSELATRMPELQSLQSLMGELTLAPDAPPTPGRDADREPYGGRRRREEVPDAEVAELLGLSWAPWTVCMCPALPRLLPSLFGPLTSLKGTQLSDAKSFPKPGGYRTAHKVDRVAAILHRLCEEHDAAEARGKLESIGARFRQCASLRAPWGEALAAEWELYLLLRARGLTTPWRTKSDHGSMRLNCEGQRLDDAHLEAIGVGAKTPGVYEWGYADVEVLLSARSAAGSAAGEGEGGEGDEGGEGEGWEEFAEGVVGVRYFGESTRLSERLRDDYCKSGGQLEEMFEVALEQRKLLLWRWMATAEHVDVECRQSTDVELGALDLFDYAWNKKDNGGDPQMPPRSREQMAEELKAAGKKEKPAFGGVDFRRFKKYCRFIDLQRPEL